jgi:hypothetical protein
MKDDVQAGRLDHVLREVHAAIGANNLRKFP